MQLRPAPPLIVQEWINTPTPLDIGDFRGRVLVIEAFQMLCPGCVSHGLPQARRVRQSFPDRDVAIIGLHTVFEHLEAQGSRAALEAFAHEYRLDFPIGIDEQSNRGLPATLSAYNMQGTPTLVVVDREGRRRLQRFGHIDDMALGAVIGTLLAEPSAPGDLGKPETGCAEEGCPVPTTPAGPDRKGPRDVS